MGWHTQAFEFSVPKAVPPAEAHEVIVRNINDFRTFTYQGTADMLAEQCKLPKWFIDSVVKSLMKNSSPESVALAVEFGIWLGVRKLEALMPSTGMLQ